MLSMQGMLAKELKAQGVLPSKFDDLALPNKRNNIGDTYVYTGRWIKNHSKLTPDFNINDIRQIVGSNGQTFCFPSSAEGNGGDNGLTAIDSQFQFDAYMHIGSGIRSSSGEIAYMTFGTGQRMFVMTSDSKQDKDIVWSFRDPSNNVVSSGVILASSIKDCDFWLRFSSDAGSTEVNLLHSLDGITYIKDSSLTIRGTKKYQYDYRCAVGAPPISTGTTFYVRDIELIQNGQMLFQRV